MQQQINSTGDIALRTHKSSQSTMLFIGSQHAFKSEDTNQIVSAGQFQVAGVSTSLLDGLARLESEEIGLVLLSSEFREEELCLFTFDARRRGFRGPVLHVAPQPGSASGTHFHSSEELMSRLSLEPATRLARSTAPKLSSPPHRSMTLRYWPQGAEAYMEAESSPSSISMTQKQQAVLKKVTGGLSNLAIAQELKCSVGSVKAILQQLFQKFAVRRRTQLIRLAFEAVPISPVTPEDLKAIERSELGWRTQTMIEVSSSRSTTSGEEDRLKDANPIEVGDFLIDLSNHRVWIRGSEALVTRNEFKLLTFLCKRPHQTISHIDLIEAVWTVTPNSRESLRVLIGSLRKKIEQTTSPRYIITHPYFGYRFVPSP